MGNIRTILDAVIENGIDGQKVRVPLADRNEFETIRTRLVKLWSQHKQTFADIGFADSDPLFAFSLCADFSPEESCGYFFLGKTRRRMAKSYTFSIIGNGNDGESS